MSLDFSASSAMVKLEAPKWAEMVKRFALKVETKAAKVMKSVNLSTSMQVESLEDQQLVVKHQSWNCFHHLK